MTCRWSGSSPGDCAQPVGWCILEEQLSRGGLPNWESWRCVKSTPHLQNALAAALEAIGGQR